MSLSNDSILKLFKITDPNIQITQIYEERSVVKQLTRITEVIEAELTYPLSHCPNCGYPTLIKNGTHQVNARLAPVNGGKYVLKLHKQRYLCKTCGTTCGATSSNLFFNHTLTPAVHQAVMELAKDSLTATEIAKLLGISDASVSRIINEHAQRPYRLKELPTQLCFDEFRSANHHMSFICCAALAHHLVTTLPGRLTTQIMDYFINRYSLTEHQRVQSVVVDLNAQYCHFIKRIFSNAEIVIDRFHIIQLAGRALDQARIQAFQTIPDHRSRLYRILKSHLRLFHQNQDTINDFKSVYLRGINEYMTQQNAIDLILSAFPRFAAVYAIYQTILTAIKQRNVGQLATLIDHYQRNRTNMDTVMNTFRKNRQAILNACQCKNSNGPLEGINRKIKTLKRNCYGFRNLNNFFNRISLIHK